MEKSKQHILDYQGKLKTKFTKWYDYLEWTTFTKYIQWYKDYFWYTGDRARAMKAIWAKDFSNIHYQLIRPIVDTFHSSSYDAQTTIKAIAQHYMDQSKTDIAQATINWALMSSKNKKVIKEVDFITQLNGEWFFEMIPQVYHKKRVIKGSNWAMVEKYDEIFEITLNYVDEFELIYNPFITDWYLGEKFIRNINSVEECKRKYSFFFEDLTQEDLDNWVTLKWISEQLRKDILEKPHRWSEKDYTNVKNVLRNTYVNTANYNKVVTGNIPWLSTSSWELNVELDYKLKPNQQLIEVVKYLDLDEMTLIFNGYVVYQWPNTLWCIPIYRTQFGNIPWTHSQDGIAQLLFHLQRQGNAFVNRWIDMINWMANPIIMMDKWIFWATETPATLKLDNRKVYQRMQGKSFERMQLIDPQATQSLLGWLQWIDAQGKEAVWLNSYSLWWEGKVERVWWAPQIKQAIHKARQSAFIENKNETLWWLAYDTMRFLQEYMPDDMSIQIYDDKWNAKRQEIKKEDISGRFSFEFDASSMKSLEDLQKRSEIIQVLPMIWDPAMRLVFEHELAKSMSINVLDREKMQQILKDQIDMEAYKQWLIAQVQAKAQADAQANQPQQTNQSQEQQIPPELLAQLMQQQQAPVQETPEEYYARTGELPQ